MDTVTGQDGDFSQGGDVHHETRGLSQGLPEGVLGLSWKGRLDDVAPIWAQGRQDGVGILLLDHKEQR
jgi:hypothetical protein